MLNEERGAVIESIVARTLRQVETTQSMIRIVGLSATLPNYVDVALFLGYEYTITISTLMDRVNLYRGLFYFDAGFRPVPLEQTFIGVKGKGKLADNAMNQVCYEKAAKLVEEGHQVMIFVHARKETVKTGRMVRDEAAADGTLGFFQYRNLDEDDREFGSLYAEKRDIGYGAALKDISKSKNKELKESFADGFGIHHAGMLRSDRSMVERLFEKGYIKVLVCTATLAWGVNLPAFAVIIKGTSMYNAQLGGQVDISILDVLQIFGRAGRPQ